MSISIRIVGAEALRRALSLPDLTNPNEATHAVGLVAEDLVAALSAEWGNEVRLRRGQPIVSLGDNYDRLRYPPDGVARDARYTRYVCDAAVLRTQMTALIPPLLRELAQESRPVDVLLACPGMVYRRDAIDRHHSAEPHQIDLWRIRTGPALERADLLRMIEIVVMTALPGRAHRVLPASHPYTLDGLQIDVAGDGDWLEIGECGLAHPEVIADAGLDPDTTSGLAMGLGLDRIVMLRKGIDDIRLLRSENPVVAAQMQNLSAYRKVSAMPPVRRDLSIVVAADTGAEELGDRVRNALGDRASAIESVEILSETPYAELPPNARARLALAPDQKNVLVRVVLRDLTRTLTHAEANVLRDEIYAAVHDGKVKEWAR